MVDHQQLQGALSGFARSLAQGFAITDVLDDLARQVTSVVRVDGAGVALESGQELRFVTAIDERTTTIERAQDRHQAGPCIDAWHTRRPVTVPDLQAEAHRWPAYAHAAAEVGIRAVASIPMNGADSCIGALDLYASAPREWSDDELLAAGVLADMATGYVVNASELDRQRRTSEQLGVALESRIIVEQAKGVLAADLNISIDEAFDVLRRHARNHNASLRSVAESVVRAGLRPT